VGEVACIDVTRRTDPARMPEVWERLHAVAGTYGVPWVVQVWTKSPGAVLAHGAQTLRFLRAAGATLTAQVTITGLAGTDWEPLVPSDALDDLPRFAEVLGGPEHITWRYDPVIPIIHSAERFGALAHQVAALGVGRAVVNFVARAGCYTRVDRRLEQLLPGWSEGLPGYDDAWCVQVLADIVGMAEAEGLRLGCCAESADLAVAVPGLQPAACADYAWFGQLSGRWPARAASRGSRSGCGCVRYFDVGSYGRWARCHRCAYCYAG
jgi:hypothetical protein